MSAAPRLFIMILLASVLASAQDLALINGLIYTVNEAQPQVEALLVSDGRITHTGSTADIRKRVPAGTPVIDLQGRRVLPGFIDNHTHFVDGGFYLLGLDLRPATSTAEFKQRLADFVAAHRGEWVTGGNWDHEQWEDTRLPRRDMIDSISPQTPIAIERFDGHMLLANSHALRLAGITADTPTPDGGVIVKDALTGEPTGVLKDNAMNLIYRVIPAPTPEQRRDATLAALAEARRHGITSIQDITSAEDLAVYQSLEKEGLLTCRIYTRLPIRAYTNLIATGIQAGFGSERLKVGSLKAFADGSLGSSTALFFEPYDQDATTRGLPMEYVSDGSLRQWALLADKNRLQLSIHAIGDSANALMLDLFEEIITRNPAWDRRFRVEHAQHVRFEDISRFAELGVIASVQPYHAIDDGVWAEKRIGKRIAYTYPFKAFLDNGVKMCFGSDWTVAPLNALYGIYAATTRRLLDGSMPGGWIPSQKISVADAIRCYTINSAFAAYEEDEKGSIAPGKLADMVVLNADILGIAPEEIKDVQVEMTILDGEIIYQRESL